MGSKAQAKTIMEQAGVPIVPGYHGADQDDALLQARADAIGYPVLIKASAGGGGKGMRVVERRDEFAAAIASARREAQAGFGDARVLLEKYLPRARHIEIQVFADTHGQCVHLFERDCSVQRRHQKVLEEAPAPGMTAQRRAAHGRGGGGRRQGDRLQRRRHRGIHRRRAAHGRRRFLLHGDEYPFASRASGNGDDHRSRPRRMAVARRRRRKLPLAQERIALHGHAIEARIYAEDPDRDFLPSIGRITYLRTPETSAQVRIDTGVREGDAISRYYDPMIAKLIAWGEDRPAALRRLKAALVGLSRRRRDHQRCVPPARARA